jgi:hypothetical protein
MNSILENRVAKIIFLTTCLLLSFSTYSQEDYHCRINLGEVGKSKAHTEKDLDKSSLTKCIGNLEKFFHFKMYQLANSTMNIIRGNELRSRTKAILKARKLSGNIHFEAPKQNRWRWDSSGMCSIKATIRNFNDSNIRSLKLIDEKVESAEKCASLFEQFVHDLRPNYIYRSNNLEVISDVSTHLKSIRVNFVNEASGISFKLNWKGPSLKSLRAKENLNCVTYSNSPGMISCPYWVWQNSEEFIKLLETDSDTTK